MHKILTFLKLYTWILKDCLRLRWSSGEIKFFLTGKHKAGISPEVFYSFSIGIFVLFISLFVKINFDSNPIFPLRLDAINADKLTIRLFITTIGSSAMTFPVKWTGFLVDNILRFIFQKKYKTNLPFSIKHIQYSFGGGLIAFILLICFANFMTFLNRHLPNGDAIYITLFLALVTIIAFLVFLWLVQVVILVPGISYFGSFMGQIMLGKYRQTNVSASLDTNSSEIFKKPTEEEIKCVQEMWVDEIANNRKRDLTMSILIHVPFAVISAVHVWIALGLGFSVDTDNVLVEWITQFIKNSLK